MNLVICDESEEETKEERNIVQEGEGDREIQNQAEEKNFSTIFELGKRPKIDFGMFLGNLNPEELID